MTKVQINNLVLDGVFPETTQHRELVETHISWVIICDQFVYKIKKPVQYSFLDFSTLQQREYFCTREIELNKRLTGDTYIEVLPVCEWAGTFKIGGEQNGVIDYAVRMHRLDKEKQMDLLILQNKVTAQDIRNLAEKIATFHKGSTIIYREDFLDIRDKFNDLASESAFLSEQPGSTGKAIIQDAIITSDKFIEKHTSLLAARVSAGFCRDCHGDLHSRNIFLLPAPLPFDCIEFNDDFRQIDVLNEVAFLCMDLDAFGRKDLSALFIKYYNGFFPAINSTEEQSLFIYYKSYRANIRAKVNSLRARTAPDEPGKKKALEAAGKYLDLMDAYLRSPDII